MNKLLLFLIIILICILYKPQREKKTILKNINLEKIKNDFNYNKEKIYFNKANLPVEVTTNYDISNINELFKFIFKKSPIILIDIIEVKILSIDNQKIHSCIFETNYGLINVDLISNKNLKHDIYTNNDIIQTNYLTKLIHLENYQPTKKKLDIDKIIEMKKQQHKNESLMDLNPEISNIDINNIIN